MNEIVVLVTGNGERAGERWGGLTIVEWQSNERMTKSADGRRDDGHLEKRTSTERIVQNVVYCHTMIMRYSRISKLSSATQRPNWDGAIRLVYVRAKVRERSLLFHAILLLHHSFRFAFFPIFLFSIRLNALCSEPNAFRVQFAHIFLAPFNCFIAYEQRQCASDEIATLIERSSQRTNFYRKRRVCVCSGADAHIHVWHLLLHIVRLCHFHIPRHRHAKWFTAFRRSMPISPILPFAHKCIWYVLWSDEVIKIQYFSACIRPTVCVRARPMSTRWPLRN